MSRVLGVNCSPGHAFLAVAVDGAIVAGDRERIGLPSTGESSERLATFLAETRDLLRELTLDRVAILMPEHGPFVKSNYSTLAPRLALETLIRVAAVHAAIPVEVDERQTVRARLGVKGPLDDHLAEIIPEPIGHYWKQGRGLAALTALAASEGICR